MWLLLAPALALAVPAVELLEAGAEPRAPLVRSLSSAPQQVEVASSSTTRLSVVGLPAPDAVQATEHSTWRALPDPEGALRIELIAARGTSTAPPEEQRDPSRLVGLTTTLQIDAQGRVLHSQTAPPPTALDDQGQRQLQALESLAAQMSVALPAEAVGVGARWRTQQVLQAGALPIAVKITSELVQREGQRVALDVDIDAAAPPTALQVDDFSGKVKALQLQARQVLVLDLDRPLPLSRETRTTLHLELSGWKGIVPVKLTMDLQQEQTLRTP